MDEPVKEEPVKEEPEDELLNMDEPVKEEPKKEEPKVSKVVSAGVVASTAMTMSPEDKLKNYIENRHSMSFAERMETIKFLKNNRKALTRKSKKDLEISASVDADSFFEKNKGFDDTTSEKLFESIKAVMGTDLSDDKVTALCDAFNMKNERNFASAYDDVDRDTRKAVTKLVSKYYNEVSSDKEITPELSMISQYIVEPVKETVALSDTYEVKTNPFLNFVGKFGMINSHKKLSETLLTGERQMKDKKMAETISKSKKNTVTESTLEIEIKKAIENKKKGLDLSEQVENKEEVAKKDISDESKSPKKDTVKKMTK